MRKSILLFILMLMPLLANAAPVEIKGIYYNLVSKVKTAEVTENPNGSKYSGSIEIPASVTYNEVKYSVTSIGEEAFYNCTGLTSITIPNSVTIIGDNAFCKCSGLTSVTIPNSVNKICRSAFSGCKGLTSVTIPNSVTSICEYAFYNCTGLTSVTIPNSVTSIGSSAFYNCRGLTSVTIPNSVTSIGYEAFSGCSGLTSVKVPVTDFSAFCNNKVVNLISNAIGRPIQLIDKEGIEIMEYIVPNDVTSIGDYAFRGCSGLISVTISNGVTSIGDYAFRGCSGLTSVTIPNSVTSIGKDAFYGCSGLTSITIPNSVTSIGDYAFYGCSHLTSVIIGSGVLSIGEDAFGVLSIGEDAFYNTKLKKTIWLTNTPPSGYSYATGAVNYVSSEQFNISNKVVYKSLSSYFEVDGVRYVPVNLSERTCDAIDCVYDESSANTKIASSVTYKGIQMTVMNIKPYLAYNNKYISTLSLDIAGGLPDYAFTGCSNLKTVTYSDKINGIGNYSFSNCSSLISLTSTENVSYSNVLYISKNINTIGNYAFNSCKEIKNVIIADGESTLSLGSNGSNPIFSSCPLDYVYIGRDISYQTSSNYGYSPFYRNTTLREMKITDKETEISDNEFYGCTNLQNITIGDGMTTIGKWAFSGCASLKYFTFGSRLENIGQEAFSDCTSLVQITSKAKKAPACGSQALDDINKWECKLYVPNGCMAVYEAADQWKDFMLKDYAKIKLSKTKATIEKGKTLTLKATITPSDLSDKSVTWKSSNTKVATVSSAGKVKGVKAGTATITCTSNATGLKATCKVTVENGFVTLNKTEAYVQKGKTMTLKATVSPETLTDKSVTWKSSDTKIATVTKAGKVKGVKYGTATITCTSVATGAKATCQVTVGKVVIGTSEVTIKKSRETILIPFLYPEDLADKSVTWKSSDKSIATVDEGGRVKGIKAGTATITCTSVATGLKGTCTVTVLSNSEARSMIGDDDELTDIKELESSAVAEPFDVYDLSGRKVLHQVTSLDGLPNGIYIVNGKKILKKD